jgi:hypothetical protein
VVNEFNQNQNMPKNSSETVQHKILSNGTEGFCSFYM